MHKYLLKSILLIIGLVNALNAQPVKLHPDNPHYFLYQEKPRIFITSAEHYGSVLNLDFDYQTYLQTLHTEGMDYTRIFTGVYVENAKSFGIEKNTLAPLKDKLITPWARSDEPGYVNGGNKFDLDQWNPNYFKRLHDFISTAEELDIIVEVTFFSSIYNEANWKFCPFYHENNVNNTDRIERVFVHTKQNGNLLKYQKAMVRKITSELNNYDNVIYEIQNEPWSDQEGQLDLFNKTVMPKEGQKWYSKSNQASELSLEWQSAMSLIVNDEESKLAKKHLIAQNYCNYRQAI
ncbi:MAG: cellulase family glycosylhydrolase, partial [Cyclobacteriaceae bacterium]|nr:cellulase family glycosylhydrolase [Cyclobacteriaceae bacterium]